MSVDDKRVLRTHFAGELSLMSYDELDARVSETYADWELVQAEREEEIGDLLFVVVNIARFLKVDPEQALRKTNGKFRRRFSHVEAGIEARGKTLQQSSIDEMEALWQAAKHNEATHNEV